jgi:hypothetical protein
MKYHYNLQISWKYTIHIHAVTSTAIHDKQRTVALFAFANAPAISCLSKVTAQVEDKRKHDQHTNDARVPSSFTTHADTNALISSIKLHHLQIYIITEEIYLIYKHSASHGIRADNDRLSKIPSIFSCDFELQNLTTVRFTCDFSTRFQLAYDWNC